MPKLEDIERLKKIVDSLGNEQAVRQERGETVEEVAPPEQTLSSDLEDLLGISGGDQGTEPTAIDLSSLDTTPVSEDLQLDDISQALGENGEQVPDTEEAMGLDVLPETFGADQSDVGATAGDQTMGASSPEGFDLGALGISQETGAGDVAEPPADILTEEPETTAGEPSAEGMQDIFSMPETGEDKDSDTIDTASLEGFDLGALGLETPDETPAGEAGDLPTETPETPAIDRDAAAPEEYAEPPVEEALDSFARPEEAVTSEGGETLDTAGLAELDLGDFGLETPAETPSDAAGDMPAEAPETPAIDIGAAAPEAPAEPPAEEALDEFAVPGTGAEEGGGELPAFDLSDFQISEPGPEEPAEIPPSVPADGEGFELPESDALIPPGEALFDQETAELPSAPEETAPDAGGGLDQFDLPDFADLGGPGEEIEPEAAPGAGDLEAQMFDLPEGEETGPLAPETGGESGGDLASFEMPDLSEIGEGFSAEPPSAPEEPAAPDDQGLDEFQLPEFSLPSEPPAEPKGSERDAPPASGIQELAGAEEDFSISQGDFDNLQATLATLPLNLKIIIEELIGEKDLKGPRLKRLLDALIAGESPKALAGIVSSITGQKIILPKSFEKKTGLAFERDRESFAYFLRTHGLKALAVIGIVAVVLFILVVGGYRYILKPLLAMPVYDRGYEDVLAGRLEEGQRKFDQASRIWDSRDQYYRFADAYREHAPGALTYPDNLYRRLLERYPGDVRGTIDYARLKTLQMKYSESRDLLEGGLLLRDMNNFDGLAPCADSYLAWAEEDPAKLKDAEYYYDTLVERHGQRTEAWLKLLEFYIRSERLVAAAGGTAPDNTRKVTRGALELKRRGYNVVDPGIYTLIAEYLNDKNELDQVPEILNKVESAAPGYALAAYERARYYRRTGETDHELPALERAVDLFRNPEPDRGRGYLLADERRHSAERAAKMVLAQTRLGEIYAGRGKPELAEDLLLEAQALYENRVYELKGTRFAAGGAFGRIYYDLGNISLGNNNLDRALTLYGKAEENGFSDPDQTYKKGFIQYHRADYDAALLEFHKANGALPENENVLFALATTEYRRRQYQIAEGYYLYAAKLMRAQVDAVPDLRPEDNPHDLNLLTNLYVTYNNLGCTYFKRSTNRRDHLITEALDYLYQASEIYDVISRYPDSLKRYEDTMVVKRRGGERLPNQQRVAPPFYNEDIIYHDKAGKVFLNERLDVIIYDLAYADLNSPKIIGGDRRPGS